MPAPRSRAARRRRWTSAVAAPTSRPRVGWLARIRRGCAVQHPGEDHLLHIAAGQEPDRRIRSGAAHVVGAMAAPARARIGPKRRKPRRWTSGNVELLDDEVLGDADGADDAVVTAVLRDARDAGPHHGPRARAERRATDRCVSRAGAGRCRPARPPARSARCPRRRRCRRSRPRGRSSEIPCRPTRALSPGTVTASRARSAAPGGRGVRRLAGISRPTIRSASSAWSDAAARAVGDLAARAQHGDAVGDGRDLLQLVRDEHDRKSARRQAPQHCEQGLRPRRGVSTAVGSSRTRMRAPR